jgi:hypothetical protein
MNKNYENEFHEEIERILTSINSDLSYQKMGRKCARLKVNDIYLEYLTSQDLITYKPDPNRIRGLCCLTVKGHEVFEKYNGWLDYKQKVIDKQNKIENSKSLAQRFWWLAIAIPSIVAILIAIFTKK